jgi:hypothetical protein
MLASRVARKPAASRRELVYRPALLSGICPELRRGFDGQAAFANSWCQSSAGRPRDELQGGLPGPCGWRRGRRSGGHGGILRHCPPKPRRTATIVARPTAQLDRASTTCHGSERSGWA